MNSFFQTRYMTAGLMEPNSLPSFHRWETENPRNKRYRIYIFIYFMGLEFLKI